MALAANNVGVAVTGEISVGDLGADAPASTAAELTGFTGLGYISEDGVTENPEVTREALRAWQNSATVRESITEARLTITFTLIETKVDVVELYHGTSVTQTATEGTYTQTVGATAGRKAFVFDVVDGAEIMRKFIAEGEIFKGEGQTFAGGSAIAYPCELVVYTDPVVMDTRLKTSA